MIFVCNSAIIVMGFSICCFLNFFVVFHYLSQLVGVGLLNISGISDAWSEQNDPGDRSRQVGLFLFSPKSIQESKVLSFSSNFWRFFLVPDFDLGFHFWIFFVFVIISNLNKSSLSSSSISLSLNMSGLDWNLES